MRRYLHRRRGTDRRRAPAAGQRARPRRRRQDEGAHQAGARPRTACQHQPRLHQGHRRPVAAAAEDRAARSRAVPLVGLCAASLCRCDGLAQRASAGRQGAQSRHHQFRHAAAGRDPRRRRAAGQPATAIFGARPAAGQQPCGTRREERRQLPLLRFGGRRLPQRQMAWRGRARHAARKPLAGQIQADHRRFRRLGSFPATAPGAEGGRRPPRRRHRHHRQCLGAGAAASGGRHRRRPQPGACACQCQDHGRRARRRGPGADRRRHRAKRAAPRATSTRWSATVTAATARSCTTT